MAYWLARDGSSQSAWLYDVSCLFFLLPCLWNLVTTLVLYKITMLLWLSLTCLPSSYIWQSKITLWLVIVLIEFDIPSIAPQTCVKYCSQAERESVFEELRPHLLTLARNTYAVHLVKKMLDSGMVHQILERQESIVHHYFAD